MLKLTTQFDLWPLDL